jgi:hypothetical protein
MRNEYYMGNTVSCKPVFEKTPLFAPEVAIRIAGYLFAPGAKRFRHGGGMAACDYLSPFAAVLRHSPPQPAQPSPQLPHPPERLLRTRFITIAATIAASTAATIIVPRFSYMNSTR